MSTLLVTGGTGYIGSHTVVEVLETEGHCGYDKIVIVDNLINSSAVCLQRMQQITGKVDEYVVFEEVDICNETALDDVFARHGPVKSVIHFAGLKAVGESVREPLKYYENNFGGSVSLVKCMLKHGCKNIVFSSSATLYGEQADCTEDKPIRPTNPYGQTKAMIEQLLKDTVTAQNGDFSAVCLRYFNPVGAHRSGLIGEDPQGIPNNLMPYIQRIASGHLPHLNVFGSDYPTPDGTGVRDYIHVTDLAQGHTAALAIQAREGHQLMGYQPINLGTGNGTSVLQLVAAFEAASGKTITKVMTDRRPGDVATLVAVPGLASEKLNWATKLSIEDMCRDSWGWVSANPNGYN